MTDWRPAAGLDILRMRAALIARMRDFLSAHGVLEVETPALSAAAASDPALHSIACDVAGARAWLHTSPEFHMKRLLAAGSGDIFQFSRVFRDHEQGRRHNREFTLLEWYRVGWDERQLMREVVELLRVALQGQAQLPACRERTYASLFEQAIGVDPHTAPVEVLRERALAAGIDVPRNMGAEPNPWLDLLFTQCVEPLMHDGLFLVTDWPATQAALARVDPGPPAVARRFEVYLHGMELANGFYELGDAAEQRRRFQQDLAGRAQQEQEAVPIDEHLLSALEAGLPECAGVALGVDRLVMCAAGVDDIAAVQAFPADRA